MTTQLDVSVLGLGTMGATLARLLLRRGYRVTVWNRTRSRAEPLVGAGAIVADTAAAAIAASPVVVVCVHDYAATNAILEGSAVAAAVGGRVLVQLTTGSPQDARDAEAWARRHGAEYLDGAIQAAPSQMARPDTTILVSGAEGAFRRSQAVLEVFGGNVKYLGEQVGSAATMDLATLSFVYGAFVGFIQGARTAEAEGLRVDTYGAIVAEMSPGFGAFFKFESEVIHSGDYRVSESPMRISVEATERLAQEAQRSGVDAEFPVFLASLFKRAMAAGHADEEIAALIKVLRPGGTA